MITVEIAKCGHHRTLKLNGHAGYNPGNDVVCSAASALVCLLNGYIETHPNEIYKMDACQCGEGWADFSISGDKEFLAVFDAVELSFRLLEQHYPNNVKVKEKIFNVT